MPVCDSSTSLVRRIFSMDDLLAGGRDGNSAGRTSAADTSHIVEKPKNGAPNGTGYLDGTANPHELRDFWRNLLANQAARLGVCGFSVRSVGGYSLRCERMCIINACHRSYRHGRNSKGVRSFRAR